jgi:hypothetical protein
MEFDIVPDPSVIEPLTLAAMSGAVSGFIGGCINPFVSRTTGYGARWLSDRYSGHPREAIETAQGNAVNFYGQVNICLDGLQQIKGFEDKKNQALTDPDYTTLFQEAVLGAARTNSEQKHRLLARLVTDRLTAEPDSLRNLAAHMACNAVPQLSNTHLKLLGALYVIHHHSPPSGMLRLPYDERIDVGTRWFLTEIAPFIPIGEITDLDLAHLTAVSCITYVPQLIHSGIGGSSEPGCWNLAIVVRNKLVPLEELYRLSTPVMEPRIEQDQNGIYLMNVWENSNMRKASLTPAGSLIGLYVRDNYSTYA